MSKSFKVGNTVRFVDASGGGDSQAVQHKLYTVKQFASGFVTTTCSIDCYAKRFELVSETPLPFTTGDKVVVTNARLNYDAYSVAAEAMGLTKFIKYGTIGRKTNPPVAGEIVTVLSAKAHCFSKGTVVVGVERENGEQHIIGSTALQKYVEPALPEYPVFKVGDRVRVKQIAEGQRDTAIINHREQVNTVMDDMVEQIGEVFTISGSGAGYHLRETSYGWMPQWLELYTATPLEEAQEEIERLKKVLDKKDAELVEIRDRIGQAVENLSEI